MDEITRQASEAGRYQGERKSCCGATNRPCDDHGVLDDSAFGCVRCGHSIGCAA